MEHLDDVCHMESHFGLHGDSVTFGARQVLGVRETKLMLENEFGYTRYNSQMMCVI